MYYIYASVSPMSSGARVSAGVFDQHICPILILLIFFPCGLFKDQFYSSNPQAEEELKKIFIGKLQIELQNGFKG
jgi:hypothetical protein